MRGDPSGAVRLCGLTALIRPSGSPTGSHWPGWEYLLVAALAGLVFVVHDVPWVLAQPFWLDESWVAISTRIPVTEVPDHTSATPVGFTLLMRAVSWTGDQGHRLLPLAFSAGSVAAAYCLARLLAWRDRRQAVLAGVLAGGAALLVPAALFRNDLKQFTAEAFAVLAVLALTANVERRWTRRSLVALAAGVVAAKLLAHTVVFVGSAAFFSLAVVAAAGRRWRQAGEVLAAGAAAAVGVVAIYLAFDRRSDTVELQEYWRDFFPPRDRGWSGFQDYLVDHFEQIRPYLGLGETWLTALLVLAGIVTLAIAGRRAVALAVPVLLVEMLVTGAAKQYPLLDLRTSHFLLVTVAVVAALGVAGLAGLAGRVPFLASLGVAAIAGALYVNETEPHLRGHTSIPASDVPSQVRYIEEHRRPGDAIAVNLRGGFGFGYYWRADRPRLTPQPDLLQGWSVSYPASSGIVVARHGNYPAIEAALRSAWRYAREGSGRMWIVRSFTLFEAWAPALDRYTVTTLDVGEEPLVLARRPVSPRQLRQAQLADGNGGRAGLSWLGESIEVSGGAVSGFVDAVSASPRRLRVAGWAWDDQRRREVDWVLVFWGRRLLAANATGTSRPDVAESRGRRAELAGYELSAALPRPGTRPPSRLRVIAVAGRRGAELELSDDARRVLRLSARAGP